MCDFSVRFQNLLKSLGNESVGIFSRHSWGLMAPTLALLGAGDALGSQPHPPSCPQIRSLNSGASAVTLPCSLSRWLHRATCSLLGYLLYFLHEVHWAFSHFCTAHTFSHFCTAHKSWSPCLFQYCSLAPESIQVWPYLTVGQIEEVSLIYCI